MKQKVIYLFALLCFAQTMMAQITSLGLVEESNIANADKYEAMRFIPELSFAGDYLYVATPNGVFKTPYGDAEASSKWEKLPLTDNLVLDIEVRGDTLIALTRDQLIYSVDGGKTAKSFSATEIMREDKTYTLDGMAVHPHNARQIIVTSVKGLMCTNDGGANWEAMDAEIPVPLTRLFYNPSNADQLVGIYNNYIFDSGALLFSHDGGQQWMYGDGVYHDSNISEIYNVAFHPTIEGKMAACGVGVYGLSEDGGVSWTGVFEPKWGQVVAHITDILYDTRNPNIMYGADWGGMQKGITTIVRSTDGGYTWKTFYEASLAPNAHVLSFDMKDNLLALYTYGGGIYLLDVDEIEKPQTPKPYLVTEGKQWAVYYEQSWNQDQPVVTHTFRLQGDTIINGFTYKKKWMSVEKDLSDWFLLPSYMREENGKVYVMNSRGEEALWFDYNAQVGDTLCLTSKQATQQCYGLVTSIDNFVLEHSDGKQRKRYEVVLGREAMSGDVYFTDSHIYIHEDVGMFNSPNYGYGLGDHTLFNYGNKFMLLCVHDNGIALYQSPEGCYKEVTPKTYLVTEGKQWAVYHDNPLCSKHRSGTITYKLQGDTILHGKTYKKKWISYKEDLSDMQPYNSFMREENGKVYIADIYGEELWFDYTAQVGDTLCFKKGSEYGRIHDIYDAFLGETDSTRSYRCYQMQVGKYNSQKRQVEFIDQYISVYESLGVVGRIMGYGLSEHHYQNSYGKCGFTLLCVHDEGEILYQTQDGCYKPLDEKPRPTNRKGYGIYYDDSYLYRYTINEAEEVTDSTDFARWHDKTVIYFDVDSVGRDAFANACFRQGQILYFTEKLRYIGQDAFGDILMLDDKPEAKNPFGDLCIVFSGENPPSIDENSIVNYADTTYRITYVVPDLATYIENDMQWTYSQLVTIDDFIAGYISPENEVVVSDSTGVDLEVGIIEDNSLTSGAALYVAARPKKDIPVRIGDGENKDIYSRAPAWMRYTVEVVMTDSKGDTLYTDKQQCNAYDGCYFEVTLTTLPEDGIVCVYSRSIDQYGNASDWTMKKIHLMNIDSIAAPENHSPYYDLMGREVSHPTRGIYIKDGRKVVIE